MRVRASASLTVIVCLPASGKRNSINAVWLNVNPETDCQMQLLDDLATLADELAASEDRALKDGTSE